MFRVQLFGWAGGRICTVLQFLYIFGPLTRVLQGTNFIFSVSSDTYLSNHVMLLSSAKLGVVRVTSDRGDIPNRRMEHESLMLCTVAPHLLLQYVLCTVDPL